MADALAAAGADIVIWGTSDEKNRLAIEQLAAHGGGAVSHVCDVSDESQVEAKFAAALDTYGRVDAVFANAGISGVAPSFMEMKTDDWRRMLQVNLDGTFFTLRAAARHMVERGEGGSLVATSSRLAAVGQPRAQHYSVSKGGVMSLMRSIAIELGPKGIRANVISPGWIDTPMTHAIFTKPKVMDNVIPRIPLRRWGDGSDFGGVAVYLASDASAYHTGDTFVVDGGDGLK
jgi:NAD(P)-dependent dehydrogenase (short-subunit alcohol dehydrogenase family)